MVGITVIGRIPLWSGDLNIDFEIEHLHGKDRAGDMRVRASCPGCTLADQLKGLQASAETEINNVTITKPHRLSCPRSTPSRCPVAGSMTLPCTMRTSDREARRISLPASGE